MRLCDIETDVGAEINGVWKTYKNSKFKVRIARVGNPAFDRASRDLKTDVATVNAARQALTPREQKRVMAKTVATHIIKDWEGLVENDGVTPIKYTPEKAEELLLRDGMADFYDWVMFEANRQESFRQTVEAEVRGNSQSVSDGSSSTELKAS